MVEEIFKKLQDIAKSPHSLKVVSPPIEIEIVTLEQAPSPFYGKIQWTPPASYLDFLKKIGHFQLSWNSVCLDTNKKIALFNAEEITSASEIIYVPEGTALGDEEISTNHLVPFAGSPDDEWAFCFDTSVTNSEYPIYYHHQDIPRARLKSNQQWHDSTPATPDFTDFTKWLQWIQEAIEQNKDPELIGQPSNQRVLNFFK